MFWRCLLINYTFFHPFLNHFSLYLSCQVTSAFYCNYSENDDFQYLQVRVKISAKICFMMTQISISNTLPPWLTVGEITFYIELYKANIFNEALKIEQKIFPKSNLRLHIPFNIIFTRLGTSRTVATWVILYPRSIYLFEWSRFILIYYPINITSHNTLCHIFF